jgi:predicted ester cyclase
MALIDKDVVAGAHAAYLGGDGAPLLALMDEEMYDNVSQRSGKAVWLLVLDWLDQSFAETSVEVNLAAAEGDRVITWLTLTGTHVGSGFPWLRGRPPSNRRIVWHQVHIYRVSETQVVEHWAVRDDLRVLEAIDASP